MILKEYLPQIINNVKPFVSSEDIKKGDSWNSTISQQLKKTNFGILCLTKENLESPWLLFEAGALSKNIEKANVCSILFDGLVQKEISTPLSLFQTTKFDKDDFEKLFITINDSLRENKLDEKVLKKSFEKWWDELKNKIVKVTNEYFLHIEPKEDVSEDLIKEILLYTKQISKAVSRFNYNLPQESLDLAKYDNVTEPITFTGWSYNHPVKVVVDPVNKDNDEVCRIEITSNGVRELKSINKKSRGVNIDLFFNSELGGIWSISYQFYKGDTYMTVNKIDIDEKEREKLKLDTIWRN